MYVLGGGGCTVEAWPDHLDQGQASIDVNAVREKTYQISIDGVSSARIIGVGCKVKFMDAGNNSRCELGAGSFAAANFIATCGNDVVTQYTIIQASQGRSILGKYFILQYLLVSYIETVCGSDYFFY